MKLRAFPLAAAFAAAAVACALFPQPVQAYYSDAEVRNNTDICAWITVYTASRYTAWKILSQTHNRPRFLKPGANHYFSLERAREVKVRAEFKAHADCTGNTVADTWEVRKEGDLEYGYIHARLERHGNAYRIVGV